MLHEHPFHLEEQPLGSLERGLLQLGGEVTYREASMLRERLMAAVEASGGAPMVIDLADVDHMDTSAVAVLVEVLGRSLELGGNLLLCAPSESVRGVFELAGLEEALNRCFSCMEELWPKLGHPDDSVGAELGH